MLCLLIILQLVIFYKYQNKITKNILEILIQFNLLCILIFNNVSTQMIYIELIVISTTIYNECPNDISYILFLASLTVFLFDHSIGIIILALGIAFSTYRNIKTKIYRIYHQRAIEILFYTIIITLSIFITLLLISSRLHIFFLNLTIIHILRLILAFDGKLQIYRIKNIFINTLFPSLDKITY